MSVSDAELEAAARRTAVTLMRLNEGLEYREAESYSMQTDDWGSSPKVHRRAVLNSFYRSWFARRAGLGEVTSLPGNDVSTL